MNSLQDLNTFSQTNVTFTDERPAQIIYDRKTPSNFTLTFNEGQPHNVPLGIDIVEIVNIEAFTEIPHYRISATIPGAVVSWPTLPAGCVVTNPSPGVYDISNITSAEIWDQVKSPIVRLPNAFNGQWSYTASIISNVGIKQWTVDLTFIDVTSLSVPTTFYWDEGVNQKITGTPNIIDEGSLDPTWMLEIVPSLPNQVQAISSQGNGGTVSFDTGTKIYSIVGTKEVVNSHLNNLYIATNATSTQNMTLTYTCNNYVTYEADNKVQNLRLNSIKFISAPIHSPFYSEDVPMPSGTLPISVITDDERTGNPEYVLTVGAYKLAIGYQPLTGSIWTVGGTGGSVAENGTYLTITGTKEQVNNRLMALGLTTPADFDADLYLIYSFQINSTIITTKRQKIPCQAAHNELSNITLPRQYAPGQSNSIFQYDTPQVMDLDTRNPTYSLTLSTSVGTFAAPGITASSNFTVSGIKSVINPIISTITFTPNAGQTTNTNVGYVFRKNGTTVLSGTITFYSPDYIINPTTPVNQTITVDEGSSHNLPLGTSVTSINASPYNLPRQFTVDVSNCPGATVSWPNKPSNVTVSNPSPGVYTISGYTNSMTTWNNIKSPVIQLPNFFYGVFVYTAKILSGGSYISWTVTATVNQVSPMNPPTTFYYTSGQTPVLTGTCQLNGLANPSYTWTMTVTPNTTVPVADFTVGGTGGTVSVNPTTKEITITGTPSQLNSRLSNITYTSIDHIDYTFFLTYRLTNTGDTKVYTASQKVMSNDYSVLAGVRADQVYSQDTLTDVQGGPLITDTSSNGLSDYLMEVKPYPFEAVSNMSLTGNFIAEVSTSVTGPSGKDIGIALAKSADDRYIVSAMLGYESFALGGQDTGSGWIVYDTQSGTPVEVYRYTYPAYAQSVWSIAASDDLSTIIVYTNPSGTYDVFTKGASWTYNKQATLPFAEGDTDVKISGDGNYAVIGKYVYHRNGTTWTQMTSRPWESIYDANFNTIATGGLRPNDIDILPSFSLDSAGTTLAMSAPFDSVSGGAMYVYTRTGDTWALQQKITQTLDTGATTFGIRHCISGNGNTLVVSDWGTDNRVSPTPNYDTLYVYRRSGLEWAFEGHLTENMYAGTGFATNYSGTSIAIASFTALVKYEIINSVWTYVGLKATDNAGLNNNWIGNYPIKQVLITSDGRKVIAANQSGPNYLNGIIKIVKLYAIVGAWNPSTKTLSFIGPRAELNTVMDLIKMMPANGYTQNFDLIYKATTPTGDYSSRNQSVTKV